MLERNAGQSPVSPAPVPPAPCAPCSPSGPTARTLRPRCSGTEQPGVREGFPPELRPLHRRDGRRETTAPTSQNRPSSGPGLQGWRQGQEAQAPEGGRLPGRVCGRRHGHGGDADRSRTSAMGLHKRRCRASRSHWGRAAGGSGNLRPPAWPRVLTVASPTRHCPACAGCERLPH